MGEGLDLHRAASPRRPGVGTPTSGGAGTVTCASCGATLEGDDPRCPTCDEPVVVAGERKLATFVFADLTGYTALAATLDPEEVFTFLRPAMTALRLVVEGFGGTVPQVMGDGFMAVFGVPVAHEDDAERAVRAALALVARVDQLNAGRSGLRLPQVHVGVNTGEVLVAGSREASGFSVVGDTVNVAARLMSVAAGGHVVVGRRTRDLTAHTVRYGPARRRRVKGKADPETTYEPAGMVGRSPEGHVAPARTTAYVGRRALLDRLERDLFATTASPATAIDVIVGEPGLGKSRLAAELRSRAEGATVVAGRCPPYGGHLPYQAVGEGLRSLMGLDTDPSADRTAETIDRLARTLGGARNAARYAAHLRLVLGQGGGDGPGPADGDPGISLRAILEALAQRKGPLLVVMDDLQWADPDLVAMVARLASSPWPAPILFLGLARPEISDGPEDLPLVTLDPLSEADLRAMIGLLLGPDVPAAVSSRLVTRSGGNPLFLEESISMLVESHALVNEEGWRLADPAALDAVPATLRLLIAARIDRLSAEEKWTLQRASVAGPVVWDRLVEAVAGGSGARRILRSLEARDVLRRRRHSAIPGATAFEFKHLVIRDVAYESLPRADRARLHLAVATWLHGQTPAMPEEPVADLAHHYEQAWLLAQSRTGPGPSPETARLAVVHLDLAAQRALVHQPRLAESLYARALRIARAEPASVPESLVAEALAGRAETLVELGRHREAVARAEEARAWERASPDRRLRARILLTLGRARSDLGEVGGARRLLTEALGLYRRLGDAHGQARAHHRLAEACRLDDFPKEVEHYRRAHELFRAGGHRAEQALVAQDLAYLLTVVGGTQFEELFEEARRLSVSEESLRQEAGLARTWGYVSYYRGDFEEAERAAGHAGPLAAQAGDRWIEVDAMLLKALLAGVAGSPPDGERLVRALIGIAEEAGAPRLRAVALLAGSRVALRAGRPALGRARLRTARQTLVRLGATVELAEVDVITASFELTMGRWGRVLRPAEDAERRSREGGWRLIEPRGPLLRGRARLGAGRPEDARRELEGALGLAVAAGASGVATLVRAALAQAEILMGTDGPVSRPSVSAPEPRAIHAETMALRGLARSDATGAAAAFADAVREWERLGLTVWLARALSFRAETLRRAGDRTGARRERRRADGVLRRLGTPAASAARLLDPVLPG